MRYDYKKPRKVKAPPIQHFLDPATRTDQPGALPPRGKTRFGRSCHWHVAGAYKRASSKNIDPLTTCVVVDYKGSRSRGVRFQIGRFPCLTASRASSHGYWISTRGRPASLSEMVKLQGFDNMEKCTN